jgi:glycosyltransferase involved in cell wall biosynthesis
LDNQKNPSPVSIKKRELTKKRLAQKKTRTNRKPMPPLPTRIAQLGPTHPYRGGIVHFNSRLAQELLARNDLEVSQFFWTKPYPETFLPSSPSKWLDTESRETFQVSGSHTLSFTNPLTWLRLCNQVRRDRHDFLITHWVHPVQFPVLVTLFSLVRLLTKTKIKLIVHNALPHEKFFAAGYLLKTLSFFTHKIILHSSSELKIVKNLKINSKKITKSFHPIYDLFLKHEKNKNKLRMNKKIFLFFGFIRPYKGIDILVEAFNKVSEKNNDVLLLIVGENFFSTKKRKKKKQLFYKENSKIKFIDRYVANEEVGSYFDMADAVVLPYLKATQSGPLQIAYAFDKPVIASNLPAFRDCIEDGKSGYLFKPGDPDDLARAMEQFLKSPLRSEDVYSVRQAFSWERYAQILLDEDDGHH